MALRTIAFAYEHLGVLYLVSRGDCMTAMRVVEQAGCALCCSATRPPGGKRFGGFMAAVQLASGIDLKGVMLERSSSNVLLLQADKVLWISLGTAGKVEMESRLPDVACR